MDVLDRVESDVAISPVERDHSKSSTKLDVDRLSRPAVSPEGEREKLTKYFEEKFNTLNRAEGVPIVFEQKNNRYHSLVIRPDMQLMLEAGNPDAWRYMHLIVDPFLKKLSFKVAAGNEMVADELNQLTFQSLYMSAVDKKIDWRKDIIAWLVMTLERKYIDLLRKRNTANKRIVDLSTLIDSTGELLEAHEVEPDPVATELERRETAAAIKEGLDQLPPKYRGPFEDRYIEGLSQDDIAQKYDISLGAAKTQIHRGKNQLAGILAKLKEVA